MFCGELCILQCTVVRCVVRWRFIWIIGRALFW